MKTILLDVAVHSNLLALKSDFSPTVYDLFSWVRPLLPLLVSVVFLRQATTHTAPSPPLPLHSAHRQSGRLSSNTLQGAGKDKHSRTGMSCYRDPLRAFLFRLRKLKMWGEATSVGDQSCGGSRKTVGERQSPADLCSQTPGSAWRRTLPSHIPVNGPWKARRDVDRSVKKSTGEEEEAGETDNESKRTTGTKKTGGRRGWNPCFLYWRVTQAPQSWCALSFSGWPIGCSKLCLCPSWWNRMTSAPGSGETSPSPWFTRFSLGHGPWPGKSPHWKTIVHSLWIHMMSYAGGVWSSDSLWQPGQAARKKSMLIQGQEWGRQWHF